ncbi:MAG TPA: hypothetical protein PK170_07610, partial [Anaerolineae bacterium]|nr:hypothetical protein [Anaerolineae bacterium]
MAQPSAQPHLSRCGAISIKVAIPIPTLSLAQQSGRLGMDGSPHRMVDQIHTWPNLLLAYRRASK